MGNWQLAIGNRQWVKVVTNYPDTGLTDNRINT
jgi:hypothetical protein